LLPQRLQYQFFENKFQEKYFQKQIGISDFDGLNLDILEIVSFVATK
jgi:hypothetical protein